MSQHGVTWREALADPAVQYQLAEAAGILLLFLALGYAIRYSFSWYARNIAARTKTGIDDFIMAAVHPPAVVIALTAGFWLAFRHAAGALPRLQGAGAAFFVIMVLLVAYTGARVFQAGLRHAGARKPEFAGVAGLGSRVGYIVAFVLGGLIILRSFSVEITPLVTSLGIAGLAVALALQETLSNLFAGLWIQSSRVVRPGDFVRMEDLGQEGWVVDISWRTTRFRTRQNHLIAVPNTKLANSVISNYDLPEREETIKLEVSAAYACDPGHVLKVIQRVVDAGLKDIPNMVPGWPPLYRFSGFGDSALQFMAIFRVTHVNDQFAVLSELRSRVYAAFADEGIEFPFPHRTLYLRQEGAESAIRVDIATPATGSL